MTAPDIAKLRLLNQQISHTAFNTPAEIVAWLGAVQAQDYAGARWSLGLRLPQATDADIEQAITDRTIVRTWPMRGTLHFVAAEDVRWMLELLTPRVIARSAGRYRELELTDTTFARSAEVITQALQGGQPLMRKNLFNVLEEAGIATSGQRGIHILGYLAQQGLICFGPHEGKQPTFVLLEEWLPTAKILERDEALAELARRYFTGHGPATIQDFMWWTGLTAADARAGLEAAQSELVSETIEDTTYWLSPSSATVSPAPTVHLLPGFDEFLLGYTNRRAALDPQYARAIHPGKNGVFRPTIVLNGRVVGTWKRTLKTDTVMLEFSPFAPLGKAESQALDMAAERYGDFVHRSVVLSG